MTKKLNPALRLDCHVITRGPTKDRFSGWAFAAEAKNIEEHRLGSLFLIGEIDPEGDEAIPPLLPLVGSQLKQEYYSKPRRRAMASFTQSLRSSNSVFAQVPKKRNPMWLGRVHLAAGAFSEGVLHFTLTGKIKGYILRGETTVDLTRRFLAEGRPHPTKLFRTIASGNMASGDRLLFATPKIFTSLFLEDVRHIVRQSPFEEIPLQVKALYDSKEGRGALYMIVGQIKADEPPKKTVPPPIVVSIAQEPTSRRKDALTLLRQLPARLTRRLADAKRLRRLCRVYFSTLRAWLENTRRLKIAALVIGALILLLLLIFRREIVL